ncbi:putative replication protein [Streptococcus sp. DD10]|nr:putative replication protein [Streptococcus sp. DD10]
MPSMKEYALQYQKLGFSVIPINPKNKMPLIGFADKPAMTPAEIENFWDGYPNANIALRTTNFFVIDIDKHGKSNGFESLKKWKHLGLIESTLQAKTASGGKHLFYFKREDTPIGQMIGFLPGVDIKANENNYVLVAPSATEKGQYEWDLEKSKEGGTMITPSKELIQAIKNSMAKLTAISMMVKTVLETWPDGHILGTEPRPQTSLRLLPWVLVTKGDEMTSWQVLLVACYSGQLMMNWFCNWLGWLTQTAPILCQIER